MTTRPAPQVRQRVQGPSCRPPSLPRSHTSMVRLGDSSSDVPHRQIGGFLASKSRGASNFVPLGSVPSNSSRPSSKSSRPSSNSSRPSSNSSRPSSQNIPPGCPCRRVRHASAELKPFAEVIAAGSPRVELPQASGQQEPSEPRIILEKPVGDDSVVLSDGSWKNHAYADCQHSERQFGRGTVPFPACGDVAITISRAILSFLGTLHVIIALRGTCRGFNDSFKETLRISERLRSAMSELGQRSNRKLHSRAPWVALRVRPEKNLYSLQINGRSISMDAETIVVPHAESRRHDEHNRAHFYFDHVFDACTSQSMVWEAIKGPLERCITARRHACVLAYGQTGSGKTHTMFGDEVQADGMGVAFRLVRRMAALVEQVRAEGPSLVPPMIALTIQGSEIIGSGLSGNEIARIPFIPNIAGHLRIELARGLGVQADTLQFFRDGEPMSDAMFMDSDTISVTVAKHHTPEHDLALDLYETPILEFSFLEIYNEGIYDLLADGCQLPQVRASANAVIPQGTTKLTCSLNEVESEVSNWLRLGAGSRTIGETVFNPRSSRSHAVATIYLNWGANSQSRIYLVDLAGSERAGKYHMSDEQLREGNNINQGLSTLARVISAIATGKGEHVPLRDSTLTWLLSDAIAGNNGKSFLLATVNPESPPETLSTLKYAKQFSTLQAKGGKEVAVLGREIRLMEVQMKMLSRELDAGCKQCRMQHGWHKGVLGKEAVHPCADAERIVRAHPFLEWTPGHSQVSDLVGYIKQMVPKSALPSSATCSSEEVDYIVDVVFKRLSWKMPMVLMFPMAALVHVHTPRYLLPLAEKAQSLAALESKLVQARESLQEMRKSERHEHHCLARA